MKLHRATQKMMSAKGHLVALAIVSSVLPLGEKSIPETYGYKPTAAPISVIQIWMIFAKILTRRY